MAKKKVNEVTRDNVVAHIVGGCSVGMLMMSNNNKFRHSADIRFRDKILKHTVPFQSKLTKEQAEAIAKIAYEVIMESDGGNNYQVNPYTFIETLIFDFEKEVRGFYDNDIMDVTCRFTAKNDLDVGDSYEYTDRLKKLTRKKIFDSIKEIGL